MTLPADVPLGIHDVRLVTPNGISNPRAFVVGDLEEFEEKEPNDDLPKVQEDRRQLHRQRRHLHGHRRRLLPVSRQEGAAHRRQLLDHEHRQQTPRRDRALHDVAQIPGPQQGLSKQ